jgi:hypothetical protein
MLWLLLLDGCTWCMVWPSQLDPYVGPLVPGLKLPIRERQWILPGVSSTPPPPEPLVTSGNCEDVSDGGPVDGPGCVTATLQCGDTVIGHTVGGVRRFDSRFYEKKHCTPATTNHDGGEERVYRLEMPEGEWRAFVWMDTPCANLDLFALRWNGEDCPTVDHNVNACEYGQLLNGSERVELVHQGEATWFLVVEGRGEEEGPFALHVQCRPGLY